MELHQFTRAENLGTECTIRGVVYSSRDISRQGVFLSPINNISRSYTTGHAPWFDILVNTAFRRWNFWLIHKCCDVSATVLSFSGKMQIPISCVSCTWSLNHSSTRTDLCQLFCSTLLEITPLCSCFRSHAQVVISIQIRRPLRKEEENFLPLCISSNICSH